TDLSDANEELRLVQAAKLQMARGRQQLLASMVILGINRIVITDGHIQAKVIFDMRASDTSARQAVASMTDRQKSALSTHSSISVGGWMSPVSGGTEIDASTEHMATVQSAVEDQSE